MKPSLRQNRETPKNAQDMLLEVLTDPGALNDVLKNIQQRVGDARLNAADIINESKTEAAACMAPAQAEAASIREKARKDAAEFSGKGEAAFARRDKS